MASIQMNTRIEENLKAVGDAGLKSAGYTPTKIVNLVWSYFAMYRGDKKKLDTLFNIIDPERTSTKLDNSSVIEKISRINHSFDAYCKNNDPIINETNCTSGELSSNKEIREQAYGFKLDKYME